MSVQLRIRLRCIAAVLAAVAQVALCTASLAEVRFGADARAHVEAGGTRLHHAHNDADCAACTGRHLLASSQLEAPARPAIVQSAQVSRIDYQPIARTAHQRDSRSRAPPALPA